MIKLIILIALVVVLFFLLKNDFGNIIKEEKQVKVAPEVVAPEVVAPEVVAPEVVDVETKPSQDSFDVIREEDIINELIQEEPVMEDVPVTHDFEPVQEESNFAMF